MGGFASGKQLSTIFPCYPYEGEKEVRTQGCSSRTSVLQEIIKEHPQGCFSYGIHLFGGCLLFWSVGVLWLSRLVPRPPASDAVVQTKNSPPESFCASRRSHSSQRDNHFYLIQRLCFGRAFLHYSDPLHRRIVAAYRLRKTRLCRLVAPGGFGFAKIIINCFCLPTRCDRTQISYKNRKTPTEKLVFFGAG